MCSTEVKECCRGECSSSEARIPRNFESLCAGTDESARTSDERPEEKLSEQKYLVSSIKNHTLYPVVEIMMKKCEAATWNMSPSAFSMEDVAELFAQMEEKSGPIVFGNKELDCLLYNTILMLRIHLIELSKVADLCNDFKAKYTQSLKKKMSQESMIGLSADSDDEMGASATSCELSGQMNSHFLTAPCAQNKTVAMLTTASGMVSIPLNFWDASAMHASVFCNSAEKKVCGKDAECSTSGSKLEMGATSCERNGDRSVEVGGGERATSAGRCSPDDEAGDPRRKALLPSKAVDVLKGWLFLHASHPYPSEEEKTVLSKETGLQMAQINNWFINARRRILPSRMDSPPSATEVDTAMRQSGEYTPSTKRCRRNSRSRQLPHSVRSFFAGDDADDSIER